VNQQTTGDVRATVHSFLAQAEYLGVIVWGLAISVVARFARLPLALIACAGLFAITILLIQRLADFTNHKSLLRGFADASD
jgi:CHASE2 domain-containing sensor protein